MSRKRGTRVISTANMDHRRSRERRYYCPACGMVRAEKDIGGVSQVITRLSPARVIGHLMNGMGAETVGVGRETCPGGEIDIVKDRAP